LESWRLPEEIVEPIRYHHSPEKLTEKGPNQDRAWILYFASELAGLQNNPSMIAELLKLGRARFGMDQASLGKFLEAVRPRVREFADVLRVDIGQCPNFAAIIAEGCKELVALSVQSTQSSGRASSSSLHDDRTDQTVMLRKKSPADSGRRHGSGAGPDLPDFDLSCLQDEKPAPARLNNDEIQGALGRGAMGVVFRALDPMLKRLVAIKMLNRERLISSEARERFLREARASAAIQHENVVTIYAVNELNGVPYLVMEYVKGASLQDRLEQSGPLPIAAVTHYARQIAAGLHAAHQRRVVHRDIKPANILVTEDDIIKITDFGLARVLDDTRLSADGLWIGTPLFMSPEQFGGGAIDHRADLFALGSVLYTLLAGKTPFSGETCLILMRQVCNDRAPSLRQLRPDTPTWLESLITSLHAKDPAQRPAAAIDVVQTIDRNAVRRY
ncbi:MAG: protein kinase, partial [Gemmataceae bacterium]